MSATRKPRRAHATALGARLRPALRRGLAQIPPLDRAASRAAERRRVLERLLQAYEAIRRAYAPAVAAAELPAVTDVDAVETEVVRAATFNDFFQVLSADGDADRALVSTTRRLLAEKERNRAMSIAHVFERYGELRPTAEVCLALCALDQAMHDTAWAYFTRHDPAFVLRWAPREFLRLGFSLEPDTAAAVLAGALAGEYPLDMTADGWAEIAYHGFAAGRHDLARRTAERAETATGRMRDRDRRRHLRERLSTLRDWLDRAARAGRPIAADDGEIPFALVGFGHPDRRQMTQDTADPLDTLAAFGHLLRHDGVVFTGEPGLVSAAERLRAGVPAGRRLPGSAARVRLCEVDRDLSRYATIPGGTWVVVSEWFTAPLAGPRFDMPLDPRLRPIFLSFHITPAALSAPGAAAYLREHGPIGCRDRDTVYLLLAAGVPAFFSGALTMTVDTVVPARPAGGDAEAAVFVDIEADGPGERRSRLSPELPTRELGANLLAAAGSLRDLRDAGRRVVTSDLRLHLATRALGCPAEFRRGSRRGSAPWIYRVIDYVDLADDDFEAIRRAISDKLAAVLGAILGGRPPAEVYALWRKLCAAEVAQEESRLRQGVDDNPGLDFDLGEICTVIRSATVTVERSRPAAGGGQEINVEFSLDGNYKHQLDVVLHSVVRRTDRPVRAFVLCRGHGAADFDRMARLFPTVSFVWLPTDDVVYGRVGGMNSWVTAATMDRTILSVLLPDVDRIIHFDLDALCLADLGELFDVDMQGNPIAAATTPITHFRSGFENFRGNAERLRREGRALLARELILRTHARHRFDFDVFNAGIMVLDLERMRADDFCGRILPYVQRFGLNGQVVLNAYAGRDRTTVDGAWNRLIRLEASTERNICHWVGTYKPWRSDVYARGRELWRAEEEHFAARAARPETAGAPPAGG